MIKRPRMYEGLPSDIRQVIDCAFTYLSSELKERGYGCDNCDQAEMLIDQLTEFFLNSNPSFRSLVYANACFYENTGEYAKECG